MTGTPEILIVGAGPTGLVAALSLAKQGTRFRLIDASSGPGEHSRATGLHARTLELYRAFGIANRAVDGNTNSHDARIRTMGVTGRHVEIARIALSTIGAGMSKYPYIMMYPQDEHERMLVDYLHQTFNVVVERGTTLTSLVEEADGIHVQLTGPNGLEKQVFKYVLGADGARSNVRKSIGVGFSGGTHAQPFYVADVISPDGLGSSMVVTLTGGAFLTRHPCRSGTTRLIGLIPKTIGKQLAEITFEDVRGQAEHMLGAKVTQVNWFSYYNVHHRVADHYRLGNVFLLGDSAHLHSPMGGQGMNTGIGDSINLSWKLAQVVQGRLSPDILDTYETERRPFGVKLVNSTDRAFGLVIQDNLIGWLIRRFFWPLLLAIVTRVRFAHQNAFRFMSQIHISYSGNSIMSEPVGNLGTLKAGSRPPWIEYGDGHDNFEVFDGVNWQLHVYGGEDTTIDLQELKWLPLHRFKFDALAKKAGFRDGVVCLMRPDTYSALIMEKFDIEKLRQYIHRIGLRP